MVSADEVSNLKFVLVMSELVTRGWQMTERNEFHCCFLRSTTSYQGWLRTVEVWQAVSPVASQWTLQHRMSQLVLFPVDGGLKESTTRLWPFAVSPLGRGYPVRQFGRLRHRLES